MQQAEEIEGKAEPQYIYAWRYISCGGGRGYRVAEKFQEYFQAPGRRFFYQIPGKRLGPHTSLYRRTVRCAEAMIK